MQSLDVQFAGRPRTVFVCEDLEDVVGYTDWVHFRTTNGYTVFGLDVESTGLDPWSEDFRVTLVQISDGQRTYVVPTHVTGAHEALIGTLENPKVKVATHSQYDAVALATLGIVLGPKVIDTYVLSRLLAPGNDTPHGLKPLCTEWLQAPELEQADVERAAYFKAEAKVHAPKEIARAPRKVESWGWRHLSPMSPEVLRYAGLDALAVRLLAPVLTDALIKHDVPLSLIEQELWLASVATAMRVRGLKVDVPRVQALLDAYRDEMEQAKLVIRTITGLPSALSPKRIDWLLEQGVEFDPQRTTEKGRPQLDKESLVELCRKYQSGDVSTVLHCSLFLSERKNSVANLENFLAHADQHGYVHPETKTLGAKTGRMSITNPALQTLKKSDPILRGCFVAEKGMSLISADFSQIEIRIAAALSGDEALSSPILNGVDTHDDTAKRLFGEDFTKDQRQLAKMVNFGSLYGGGAGTLSKQAGITVDEARGVVTKWKATYPQIARMAHILSGMNVVVNPAGRRIPTAPQRPYANLNYMIQSTARDLFVVAVERIVREFGVQALWLFVHDEVLLHVPNDQADDAAKRVQDIMHTVFYGIPIDAEAEVLGGRWGRDAA